METKLKIKTPDKKIIYGTLNKGTIKDSIIIFVHGLTGHQNEHQFYNAAQYFPKKGYNTFRFDLYSGDSSGRRLDECDMDIHAKDLDTVITYFRKKYVNIFLVGHSLGCPVILLSNIKNISGIVFWDPSYIFSLINEIVEYDKKSGAYIIDWSYKTLISKKLRNQFLKMGNCTDLILKTNSPIKIIVAGNGALIEGGKQYYHKAHTPKQFKIIKNATHGFDEEGTEQKLFQETYNWIKKYDK